MSAEEKSRLAATAKTPVSYLSQIAHGWRGAGIDVIQRLMAADNRITLEMMRPSRRIDAA